MRFSKRHATNNISIGIAFVSIMALVFMGLIVGMNGVQNSALTHTTQTTGTITYYSIVDGSATIVINTHSTGNQTVTCSLKINHLKYSGDWGPTWPYNDPLVQASDPSVILRLKVGETISIISGINGCTVTILA